MKFLCFLTLLFCTLDAVTAFTGPLGSSTRFAVRASSTSSMHMKLDGYKRRLMCEQGRMRLCVHRSNNHIYAQVIDDTKHAILASASTMDGELKDKLTEIGTANKEASKLVGELISKRAVEKGISKVFFDRQDKPFHGRVAAVAEGARAGGLVF